MSGGEGGMMKTRKVRSDKKREVKPTVSSQLKDCIHSLAYVTNQPIKTTGEIMCQKGLGSRKVIEHLSEYFRRDLRVFNTIYMGDMERESMQRKIQQGTTERITLRFPVVVYESINALANAMDVTPSKATALLLDASMHNSNLVNQFVKDNLREQLDEARMKELQRIFKYIKKNNPYDEEISWLVFMSWLLNDLKEGSYNLKKSLSHWIDKYK